MLLPPSGPFVQAQIAYQRERAIPRFAQPRRHHGSPGLWRRRNWRRQPAPPSHAYGRLAMSHR
jgi:hypothetical protein